jgi:hypothetical protein
MRKSGKSAYFRHVFASNFFRPTTMQKLPNLAFIETKRITVHVSQSERLSKHFYKNYTVEHR